LTEELTGGTTPETEAIAPVADLASEQAVEAVAIDEPAETSVAAESEISAPPAPAAPEPEAVAEAEAVPAVSEADLADAPAAEELDEEVVAAPVVNRPEPTTMEELLAEQDADIKSFKHGDVVEGTVVRIDRDEILVDIGAKSEGVVSNRELYGRHADSTTPALGVGDVVLVYVLQPESQEGHVVLSLRRAGLERKWRSMQEQF